VNDYVILTTAGEFLEIVSADDARAALVAFAEKWALGVAPPMRFFEPDSFRSEAALGAVFDVALDLRRHAYVARLCLP